jgi:hypothetical protein
MEQARVAGRGEYERDDMIVLPARMLVEVKAEAYHLGELLPCVLLLHKKPKKAGTSYSNGLPQRSL